jgi:hypothetical protein
VYTRCQKPTCAGRPKSLFLARSLLFHLTSGESIDLDSNNVAAAVHTPLHYYTCTSNMLTWEGIEDAASEVTPVWLSKAEKEKAYWKPLRKSDCHVLNGATKKGKTYLVRLFGRTSKKQIPIECGRITADLETNSIRYNFIKEPARALCSAIWFRKRKVSKENVSLHPVDDAEDSKKIEAFYQTVCQACSALGAGVASVLDKEVDLSDETKVSIIQKSNSIRFVCKAAGRFQTIVNLQRGFGEYKVDGEEEELLLGPVKHLCFVIHGVGEALFTKEGVSIEGLVETTDKARIAMQKMQIMEWRALCKKAKTPEEAPPPPDRIELVPIQWSDEIHDSSSSLMKSLRAVSLTTVPALRMIANDVVFDGTLSAQYRYARAGRIVTKLQSYNVPH